MSCFPFSGSMHLSLGIVPSAWEVVFNLFIELVSETYCDEVFVILSAILLPVKWPVVSNAYDLLFLLIFVLSASVATLIDHDFSKHAAASRSFGVYLSLKLLTIFLAKYKNWKLFTNIRCLGWTEYLIL